MLTNLIAFVVLVAVAAGAAVMVPDPIGPRDLAAAPARAARWLSARRVWRRAARAAWVAGADLAAGWMGTAPAETRPWHDVPPRDETNACKDGRPRCRECRLGGDCRDSAPDQRPAYAAGRALPRPGRHDQHTVAARWLAGDWWDSPLPATVRLRLARLAGAVRAPVQLAGPGLGVRLP